MDSGDTATSLYDVTSTPLYSALGRTYSRAGATIQYPDDYVCDDTTEYVLQLSCEAGDYYTTSFTLVNASALTAWQANTTDSAAISAMQATMA